MTVNAEQHGQWQRKLRHLAVAIFLWPLTMVLTVSAAQAVPTISGVVVDQISHSSARVSWTTSVPATSQILYGLSTPYSGATGLYPNLITSHSYHLSGLAPATVYHFCPSAKDGSNSTNACDGTADDYTLTTLPMPANEFADPPLPAPMNTAMPTQSTRTWTVTTDCGNLQSSIDQAALGDTIAIPAGTVCTGNYMLKNKTLGSGWIIVRTATPDASLPPPGTRISPSDAPLMAVLRTPSFRVPGGSGQAAGAIQVESGAHHYRFIGLEITHARTASAGNPDPGPYYALVRLDVSVHHIIFDRCYLHGQGYPDRLQNAFYPFDGSNVAVIDSYISKINYWQNPPPAATSLFNSEGSVVFQTDLGPGPFKIDNNHIEGQGVSYFVTDDHGDALVSDVQVTHNHFYNDDRYRYGSAVSDGHYYYVRQFFELKKGVRFLVDGNVFENAWSDINQGFSIELAIHWGNNATGLVQLGNVTVTNNIIRNGPNGINLNCHDPAASVSEKSLWGVKIVNNLFDHLNGYTRVVPGGAYESAGGIAFSFYDGCEDVEVRHNTIYDNRGNEPATLISGYERSGGLLFQDNILWLNNDSQLGGITHEDLPAMTPTVPPRGLSTVLDGKWTQMPAAAWTYDHNVIVAGYVDSRDQTGPVDLTALCQLYACPAGNFWAQSPATVGFSNAANADYSLAGGSYKGLASDGADPGVNWSTLQAATLHTMDGQWSGVGHPPWTLALHWPAYQPLTQELPLDFGAIPVAQVAWECVPAVTSPSAPSSDGLPGATAAGTIAFTLVANAMTPSQHNLNLGRYQITVKILDDQGNLLAQASQPVTFVNADLSSVKVYPNPWRWNKHARQGVTFAGLTVGTTVTLFAVSGHEVKALHTDGPSIVWDLTNDSGEKVASGIYLYVIKDTQGNKARGKLAIIK